MVFIRKTYKKQLAWMRQGMLPELDLFQKQNQLSPKSVNKITFYYGLAVPVIADFYSLLFPQRIGDKERHTLTYMGGFTGLFDDFFDEMQTEERHIVDLIQHPQTTVPNTPEEKLMLQFYQRALENTNISEIKKRFIAVYDAQVASKKQQKGQLTSEAIRSITAEKGGASLLFYRSALDGGMSADEVVLLSRMGFLGQLENDIFDVYKDYQEGIATLATQASSIQELKATYQLGIDAVLNAIPIVEAPKKHHKKFRQIVTLITSRGWVCLDQLLALETNGCFNISQYTRAQLVCDMEAPKNRTKWLKYYLRG